MRPYCANRFRSRSAKGCRRRRRSSTPASPVAIAYFGGSITEQNGWRIQSAELLKKLYPKAAIRSINAAIGGTGSDLGAFRLAHDVLRHKPDLVFIEFAVNDAGAKDDRVRKAVEGIVRQIRKALPDSDICFVYTVTKGNLKDYQAGRLPRPASIMEEIAEHYRLPSVNLSYEVARLEKEGKLVMSGSKEGMTRVSGDELDAKAGVPRNAEGKIVFSGDGVHPYPDTGHVLYTRMLEQAFPALLAKREQKTRILPAPMRADCWENASAFPLDAPGIRLGGRCGSCRSATRSPSRSHTGWRNSGSSIPARRSNSSSRAPRRCCMISTDRTARCSKSPWTANRAKHAVSTATAPIAGSPSVRWRTTSPTKSTP